GRRRRRARRARPGGRGRDGVRAGRCGAVPGDERLPRLHRPQPPPARGRLDRRRLGHAHGWPRAAGPRPPEQSGNRRSHGGLTADRRGTMRSVQETSKIWMNGELVDWADATVHVGTHGLHYGSGVFEGIRAYDTDRGTAIFRLTEHMARLENSAKLLYMELPYSLEELKAAAWEVVGANALPECYLRPIAYFGYGQLGVGSQDNPVDVAIMSWPWGTYLGDDALRDGIRVKISSWQRVGPNVIPHAAKATGVYINSMLAVGEAVRAGYQEAILLTAEGYIADGSGESVFVVRDGVVYTPDLSASILIG